MATADGLGANKKRTYHYTQYVRLKLKPLTLYVKPCHSLTRE
jgi:hypothetical protein